MMLNDGIRPTSVPGIKRLAKKIKKENGISYSSALKLASQAASFQNYPHARRVLHRQKGLDTSAHRLFLTYYWTDYDTHAEGREVLEITLYKPPLEICSKSEMRIVRGLSAMRLAAPDHLIADNLAPSQDFARDQLCQCARVLEFMQATGLRPLGYKQALRAKKGLDKELPRRDHATDWYDPVTGQYVLIDEPYTRPIVSLERAEWAMRNGWRIQAAAWQGMYNPPACSLFVATREDESYDFGVLMERVDALPMPVTPEHWTGGSTTGHEIFISPLAKSPQDRRRARAKGTVIAQPSKATVPCSAFWGTPRRKPNGSMPIAVHQDMGRMIKAILRAVHVPWIVDSRIKSLRSTLENWINAEVRHARYLNYEIADIYYGDFSPDDPYVTTTRSLAGIDLMLSAIREKLTSHYPDCAPLRSLLRQIDTSRRHIQKISAPTE